MRGAGGGSSKTGTWIKSLGTRPSPKTVYPINTFIQTELNDGNWTAFGACYVLGQDNATNALTPIVGISGTATAVNSPTFTAYEGYASDGSTSYISSPAYTNNLIANSTFISNYWYTAASASGGMGGYQILSGTYHLYIISPNNGGDVYAAPGAGLTDYLATGTVTSPFPPISLVTSLYSGGKIINYLRGSSYYTSSGSPTVEAPSGNPYICGANVNGTPGAFDTGISAFTCFGNSNSLTSITSYYNAVQLMATKMGWNV